ncbi:arylsulfatase precursor [Microdochium trichocladiopsis]|uniref:Arylsulfatase n=1 Tax=Microdochium trichocladiopsis TaxID=1682393 RepID=A0A9P8YAC9_9PEZI|nr:arylsulfatase precursor [Microdochium trichocladiopsis]KAH7034746.1 arylsulfatase precursor [Microdochium trichocladiopsis]
MTTTTTTTTTNHHPPPNFLFILTDDQDLLLDSLTYQPLLQKHITDKGTRFDKHYCTIALCCPSRVSMLTGRAAHNTNVTDVSGPYGGYAKFLSEGWNERYLPVWLQEAGYDTYYTGKLMNGLSVNTYNKPFPKGWNRTDFFLDPYTYLYNNVTVGHNEEVPKGCPGNYSTDLALARGLDYLDAAIPRAGERPFFIGVAPIAPHSQSIGQRFDPAVPADRHKDLFPDARVPRRLNFNPDEASGAGWIKTLERFNDTAVDYLDEFHRLRIRSLQAVDELVEALVERLEQTAPPEVVDNTYIIYTSDNGYHIGQHRLAPGKACAIEEDINIPFIVRGPGVAQGQNVSFPSSHTDLVPTIFELAGIPLQEDFDGVPIPVTVEQQLALEHKAEHVNVEFWGFAGSEGQVSVCSGSTDTNTYKSLRIVADDYDLSYTVWCTNEHELYDMKADPGQLKNIYANSSLIYGFEPAKLIARVDALLLTLKDCTGVSCRLPWQTLHPAGDVRTLAAAMDAKFDDFYLQEQKKVSFSACAAGYLLEYEGAVGPVPYGAEAVVLERARWEDWT